MDRFELSKRIRSFLSKYAEKKLVSGEEDEGLQYTGPDPLFLDWAAEDLETTGIILRKPWSEWGSGCYKPYTDKEGKVEHDFLVEQIRYYIKHHNNDLPNLV